MKYIFLAMTMLLAGGSVLAETSVKSADEALNLEESNSSDFRFYGKYYGGYRTAGYPGSSYPYNYTNYYNNYYSGCGASYSVCGGLSWGLYNPFYIYRSPPAVYSLDSLGLTPMQARFPNFGMRSGYLGNVRAGQAQGDSNTGDNSGSDTSAGSNGGNAGSSN